MAWKGTVVEWKGEPLDLQVQTNPPESILAVAYLALSGQGMLERYWQEGVFKLSEFLVWALQEPSRIVMSCLTARGSELTAAGFGTIKIQSVAGQFKRGEVSAIFLKQFHDRKITLAFSELMIDMAFEEVEGLQLLTAAVPVHNRAMIWHARRLGFQITQPIEHFTLWRGKPTAAVVCFLTKEAWTYGAKQEREASTAGYQAEAA